MSQSEWLEAVVLRRWDYGEKDQIISLLTREKGRIQGIAKGAKASLRRFGPALDLFCWIRVQVRERKGASLNFLEQAQVLSNFPRLRQDYASILIASGLLELAQSLFKEGMAEEAAFSSLLASLQRLEEQGPQRRIFWAFLIENLESLGWGLHLNACHACGKSLEQSACLFDIERGIGLCIECGGMNSRLFQLSEALARWIRSLDEGALSSQEEASLQELLEKHCQHHLHLASDWSRFLRF